MLVSYNIQASKDKEIEVLVQHIAKQFNITDPLDIADLRQTLIAKTDTSNPLIDYQEVERASSSSFRTDVRNSYIDLAAYFIQLRDVEAALRLAEIDSRRVFDSFENRRKSLASLIQPEDSDLVRKELFSSEEENGYYSGVRVNNGKLSLRMQDVNTPYQLVSTTINTYPSANAKDRIYQSETGLQSTILDTGVGAKLWSVDVYTPEKPVMYWTQSISGSSTSEGANYLHKGILIDVRMTLSKAVKLNYISAKFLTKSRLVRAYIDISSESEPSVWEPLLTADGTFVQTWDYSRTLEVFDFKASETSNQIRLVLNVNQPETTVQHDFILDKMYSRKEIFQGVSSDSVDFDQQVRLPDSFLYTFGIYNLRLRNREPAVTNGIFISDSYITDQGAVIGAKIKSNDSGLISGSQIYTVKFGNSSEMALLPEGSSREITELVDTDARGFAILSFPSVRNVTSLGYTFEPLTSGNLRMGTIQSVRKNGTEVLNGRNIPVSYQTHEVTRYAFTNESFNLFTTQYANDPGASCTIFIRIPYDNNFPTPYVSVYEAIPVASYYISETFFGQSTLELDNFPWIDISGNYPVKLTILPEVGGEAFSNETHPNLLVDRTNYYNRRIQPMLENYDAVDRYEYFIRGNKIYLNSGLYHQIQVDYPVKTEGVRVQINQQANGNLSPWVDDYTLYLTTQKD